MRDGLVTLASPFGSAETFVRLEAAVRGQGLAVFATIDHAQAARDAGLNMKAASLLIFGSPRAGTPLMQRAPTLAIDLPLKALIWEDEDGATWLSYNDPAWLAQRHRLGDLDAPTMVWEYEGGAVAAGPEAGPLAPGHQMLGATSDQLRLRAMAHALSEIAGDVIRPFAP
jgi:uncharacterized protein (DUF302 family)